MILSIKIYPSICLMKTCKPVVWPDPGLAQLAEDLKETVRFHKAHGLAGNQVGVLSRILAYTTRTGDVDVLVNPVIIESLPVKASFQESCLSLPTVEVNVFRSIEITVDAFTIYQEPVRLVFEDMEARIVQHGIDHLNGKTILDTMSSLLRSLAIDKFHKRHLKRLARRREVA